jgi:protein-tyrosine phosphatase
MLTALDGVDLVAIRRKPANTVLVIESSVKRNQGLLKEHLQSLGAYYVEHQHLPHPRLWTWTEAIDKIHVPHQVLEAVVSWLAKVALSQQ